MRRFSCTVKMALNLRDDTAEESDVEEAVLAALKRLRPTEVTVEDIEELDVDPEAEDDGEDAEAEDPDPWDDEDD